MTTIFEGDPAHKSADAHLTTSAIVLADLQHRGLDALFDEPVQRRLRRCSLEGRAAIRRRLSRFTFHQVAT
jgi:hypothetical protein